MDSRRDSNMAGFGAPSSPVMPSEGSPMLSPPSPALGGSPRLGDGQPVNFYAIAAANASTTSFGSNTKVSWNAADTSGETLWAPLDEKAGEHQKEIKPNTSRFSTATTSGTKKRKLIIIVSIILVVLALAIAIPIVVAQSHKSASTSNNAASAGQSAGAGSSAASATQSAAAPVATTGGDGSTVTRDDGSTFVYSNKLGGTWVSTPFQDTARPQSDTPALNQPWDYSTNIITGVNLGGWLVLEPFITPAYYEPYLNAQTPAVDEYTLMQNLGTQAATVIENHYNTFITEDDFAQIAGAGFTHVRIPLAFWAIETIQGEPFLEGVSWTYFLKAIRWARKYGLRINLDLHAVPGSQNGYNHSGRYLTIAWLQGPMGMVNAQRSLNYIRTLAEFISQPQYKNVITIFSPVNEPNIMLLGNPLMEAFYAQAYQVIRTATGVGAGNGPMIAYHAGFVGPATFQGYLANSDRVAFDAHYYFAFGNNQAMTMPTAIMQGCQNWAVGQNVSMGNLGFQMVGEWSLAVNDCGWLMNGVGLGTRYEGTLVGFGAQTGNAVGNCDTQWTNSATWSPQLKQQMQTLALAQMDAYRNSFFWSWKIGNSTRYGRVASPMWSVQLGIQEGFWPTNMRSASGTCQAYAAQNGLAPPPSQPWQGPLMASATGGAGAGQNVNYAAYPWPPASFSHGGRVANLPQYTATGAPITLSPGPTPTAMPAAVALQSGWANAADNGPAYAPVAGCNNYLDPYAGPNVRGQACQLNQPAAAAAPAKRTGAPHSPRAAMH